MPSSSHEEANLRRNAKSILCNAEKELAFVAKFKRYWHRGILDQDQRGRNSARIDYAG